MIAASTVLIALLFGSVPLAPAHGPATVATPNVRPVAGLGLGSPSSAVPNLAAAAASLHAGEGPALGLPWACSPGRESAISCSASAPSVVSEWQGDPTLPPLPPEALLTYDAVDGVTLLVDQAPSDVLNPNPDAAAFYSFNGTGWTLLPLENGPPYSAGASLSYDTTSRQAVYIAPVAIGYQLFETATWTYAGGIWSRNPNSLTPPARLFAGLSDDPSDGGVLLFGGENASDHSRLNDTWVFASGAWAPMTSGAAAPDPRTYPALAWDTASGSVVLLGGCDAVHPSVCANDTWTFANDSWSELATAGPPIGGGINGSSRYLLGDDPALSGLVAAPLPAVNQSSTSGPWFQFHAGAWSPLALSSVPPTVNGTALAFDSVSSRFVVFPVLDANQASNRSTAFGEGSIWSTFGAHAPPARAGASMTYDAADGYVVLTGGYASGEPAPGPGFNDTWKFTSSVWSRIATNRSPPSLYRPGLVYDQHDGYVLLFGGSLAGTASITSENETWEFTKGGWSRITPRLAPSGEALNNGAMAYDGADGYVLWVGGPPGSAYTWTYLGGNWTNRTAGERPSGPPANGLVYDASDDYVVEQGTLVVGAYPSPLPPTAETWTFLNGVWTNRTAGIRPPPVEGAALAYDPAIPGLVLFGGVESATPGFDGYPNATWVYLRDNWTSVTGPFDPPGLSAAAMVYDVADGLLLLFGGAPFPVVSSTDCNLQACNTTFVWSPRALLRPYIAQFSAGAPTVDLGHVTNLTTVVVGGTGPLRFIYAGLPPGCTPQNTSILTCTPSAVGVYRPSVTVVDSAGNPAGTTTGLNVSTPLAIAVFNASPADVPIGLRTLLSVAVTGGTGQTFYSYLGLPPGCGTQSIPTLPCTPWNAGNYTVEVTAVDTGGGSASTALDLQSEAVGPPGGPSITGFAVEPSALVLGNSTTIVVNASGGAPPLRYAYSGLPPGCASLNVSRLACSPTTQGVYQLTLSVEGANGSLASVMTNLTVFPAGGGGGLQITSFSGGPPVLPLGESTVISVTATDGQGPLAYSYSGLPPGCSSANSSSLNCTPTANGTFRLYVLVQDPQGDRSGAFGTLLVTGSVAPFPSISLFSAAPRTLRLGAATVLFVSVDGGSAPLRFAYSDLPTGCVGANSPQLNCTPTAIGHFPVVVSVTDGRNRTANASLTIVVLPALVPAPGNGLLGGLGLGSLASVDGALALLFVVAAALLFAGTEITVRRTKERVEGQDLLRALSYGPDNSGPHPADVADDRSD